jgi:hypothetical protein
MERLPVYQIAGLPDGEVTGEPGCWVARYKLPLFPGYWLQMERLPVNQAAGLPDRGVAEKLSCWVARWRNCQYIRLLGCPIEKLQVYQVAGL